MPFDEPGRVVNLPKDEHRLTELLDGVEGAHPQEVLLQGPNEALRTATARRGSHEGRRALDTQEGKFLLEGVGHVLAAVIVPNGQTAPDPLGESAEVVPHALPEGPERLDAGGAGRAGAGRRGGGGVAGCGRAGGGGGLAARGGWGVAGWRGLLRAAGVSQV